MLDHVTVENFKDYVKNDFVVVDFWATWCGPCRMLTPNLEKLNQEDGIKIGKVNVDEEEAIAQAFQVESIPTIMIFKAGKLVSKQVGFMPYDALKAWVTSNK